MSKVRYINAYECQGCYQTYETEKEVKDCCDSECSYEKLNGFECKQCFKIYDTIEKARFCHPDPKPMSFKEFGIDYEEPVDEEDNSDEILLGGISIIDTLKPIEVIYE